MKLIEGLDGVMRRGTLHRWDRIAATLPDCGPTRLKAIRREAADLRGRLDRIMAEADHRLTAGPGGPAPLPVPAESEWAWRPPLFTRRQTGCGQAGVPNGGMLDDGVKVFHDCPLSEITVRQRPGHGHAGAAPHGIALDVMGFEGSFLSLAVDLPQDAVQGLSLSHIVQVDLVVEWERPVELFVRLNVKHGPNVEQVVREPDLQAPRATVEIDLAYSDIVESQIERAWVDVILGQPAMNRLAIRDLIVSRRLRAEM